MAGNETRMEGILKIMQDIFISGLHTLIENNGESLKDFQPIVRFIKTEHSLGVVSREWPGKIKLEAGKSDKSHSKR